MAQEATRKPAKPPVNPTSDTKKTDDEPKKSTFAIMTYHCRWHSYSVLFVQRKGRVESVHTASGHANTRWEIFGAKATPSSNFKCRKYRTIIFSFVAFCPTLRKLTWLSCFKADSSNMAPPTTGKKPAVKTGAFSNDSKIDTVKIPQEQKAVSSKPFGNLARPHTNSNKAIRRTNSDSELDQGLVYSHLFYGFFFLLLILIRIHDFILQL